MYSQKISVSIPMQLYEFIDEYQIEHHYRSRSEVIKKALCLLQQQQLEACYKEANEEIDETWDAVTNDGLEENETW
jgi:antitoxin ParD1/3/4